MQEALDHLVIFSNAHLSLQDENQLAVYAASSSEGRLLYSSLQKGIPSNAAGITEADANTYSQFRLVDRQIFDGVRKLMADGAESPKGREGSVLPFGGEIFFKTERADSSQLEPV